MAECTSTIPQETLARWPVRTAARGTIRLTIALVCIAFLLTDVGILAAEEWSVDPACAHANVGQRCERHGRSGACQPGECCHLDYAGRKGDAPPTSVCKPCLTCSVPRPKLEPLVLPRDDTPAVAPPVEATPSQPLDVTPVLAPPAPTATPTSVPEVAPRAPAPPAHGFDVRWAWLAVPVVLAAWFLLRRNAGGQ